MATTHISPYLVAHNKRAGWFTRFSSEVARLSGRPFVFIGALAIVALWALAGPLAHYSDFWQLTINTGTTIVTFLMVFLIQNTQNRDTAAMHIKLDELIRATAEAHNSLLNLEELSESELERFHRLYIQLAAKARRRGIPSIDDDGNNEPESEEEREIESS